MTVVENVRNKLQKINLNSTAESDTEFSVNIIGKQDDKSEHYSMLLFKNVI